MNSTANIIYLDSLQKVLTSGIESCPRGIKTKEILNLVSSINMEYPIVSIPDRKIGKKFMFAEAYWITQGSPLVEEISPYNKHIAKFSDDGYIFNGAYGPMFNNQFNTVVNTLNDDKDSRQAVCTIWHPNPVKSKDHKCTIMLHWMIRNGRLNCTVYMRSNDLWLGRAYDIFNFTMMTVKVLTHLSHDLKLGELTLIAGSAHVYETNYLEARKLIDSPFIDTKLPDFHNWKEATNFLLMMRDL